MIRLRERASLYAACQEIDSLPQAEVSSYESIEGGLTFEGFSVNQERWMRKFLEISGLVTERIKVFRAVGGVEWRGNGLVGGQYDTEIQEITLYPDAIAFIASESGQDPFVAFQRILTNILVHEVAHSSSPTLSRAAHVLVQEQKNPLHLSGFDTLYSSEDAERLHTITLQKAIQSLETRTYLNGYHRALAERVFSALNRGDQVAANQAFAILCVELEAIVIELRYLNPAHLAQVDRAMDRKLSREERATYVPYLEWGSDIVGTASGKSHQEVDAQVRATQAYIKATPFPLN